MNWDAVGAIGEMAGAAAVISTLFYLAVQVKQATSVARASARQVVAQMNADSLAASFDSHLLSIAAKKTTLDEELTPDEHSNYVRWILLRVSSNKLLLATGNRTGGLRPLPYPTH